jgi:hypothetical protein
MSNIKNISKTLQAFSQQKELWVLTEWQAIKEYLLSDNPDSLVVTDFILVKERQELVFWNFGKETFLLRTTYLLFTKKQKTRDVPFGEYYMDADVSGKFVDDNLMFFDKKKV